MKIKFGKLLLYGVYDLYELRIGKIGINFVPKLYDRIVPKYTIEVPPDNSAFLGKHYEFRFSFFGIFFNNVVEKINKI